MLDQGMTAEDHAFADKAEREFETRRIDGKIDRHREDFANQLRLGEVVLEALFGALPASLEGVPQETLHLMQAEHKRKVEAERTRALAAADELFSKHKSHYLGGVEAGLVVGRELFEQEQKVMELLESK